MITIKKYRNRRLYDTSTSRYVKLEDVAEMVRGGQEFEVIDVNSGEDITRVVLTQIIVENAKDNEQEMPIEFLRQMISSSGRARKELMSKYASFVTGIYQKAQEEIRDRFQHDDGETGAGMKNPLEALQRFMQPDALEAMWPGKSRAKKTVETPAEPTESTAAELSALRAKLEELEKAMSAATESAASQDTPADSGKED